jgi:hypothetical protein
MTGGALPSVEKPRKVGNRGALIDEMWSAIEMFPDPEPQSEAKRTSKQDEVIAMLRRPEGVTADEVASVTGWQVGSATLCAASSREP